MRTSLPPTGSHSVLLLEDNSSSAERQNTPGVGRGARTITVRVHRVNGHGIELVGRNRYRSGELRGRPGGRTGFALSLLLRATKSPRRTIVVAGAAYGGQARFVEAVAEAGFHFVVQLRPSSEVVMARDNLRHPLASLLKSASWHRTSVVSTDGRKAPYAVARLGKVVLPNGDTAYAFAGQSGGIMGTHRGTILGLSSFESTPRELVRLAAHATWIRPRQRSHRRSSLSPASAAPRTGQSAGLSARSNITVSQGQDRRNLAVENSFKSKSALPRSRRLRIVELFAGAGGMGLGFLLAEKGRRGYRLVHSAEVNPIYVRTLAQNHQQMPRRRVPQATTPVDLRSTAAEDELDDIAASVGGIDVLIGGPPCQGFSMANRNSWSSRNPNNRMIEVFLKHVRRLKPLVFLMENVQGILWTPGSSGPAVVDVIEARMRRAGYVVFPKLLDAVWYGVPQHRTRFFLLGLHTDLGYRAEDFGSWGPFPAPTHGPGLLPPVTVADALRDLPRLRNGAGSDVAAYHEQPSLLNTNAFLRFCRNGAQPETIHDHVTSRHADYVLERFRRIPQGGNWRDIEDCMTNYADVSRTHSNIYRRLRWREPSVTLGHYRKSMLVHPTQNRGLSLREAARLQSFPDWFRFAGTPDGRAGGLMHKQQQLANAVCPLVTKAVAEHLLAL